VLVLAELGAKTIATLFAGFEVLMSPLGWG
jgi:hypothetical protein